MEVNHFQIPLLAPRDGESDTLDRSNDTAREMRVRRALLETLLHLTADIFGREPERRLFVSFARPRVYMLWRGPAV